jgi:hypothetical protein
LSLKNPHFVWIFFKSKRHCLQPFFKCKQTLKNGANIMTMQTQTEDVFVQKHRSRKGGRPPLLAEERRRNQFTIGFTDAQLAKLEERAEAAGVPEIELIRRLSLNLEFKTIPIANRKAVMELNAIGRNINQVARTLSTGLIAGLDQTAIEKWMANVQQKLNAAGLQLVDGERHGNE